MAIRRVFEPIQIGQLTLDNRVMMGSMHVGLERLEGAFSGWPLFMPSEQKAKWA